MRHFPLFAPIAATGLALGGCATDPYGYDDNRQLRRAATGAAIGAAAGAAGAAIIDESPVAGAAIGAVAGGAIGAATYDEGRWYRDDRGYCFYVTRDGRRIYDYDRRSC